MTLPELCVRRPVMTTLVMAGLLIFGLFAYRALPVSELPHVDFPTITVTASLPGASPETMAAAVAQPLEAQFSAIEKTIVKQLGKKALAQIKSLYETEMTERILRSTETK